MKALKSTLLALVLALAAPAVSFANGKNCNGRTNSLSKIAELRASLCDGSGYSEFCGTVHQVGIVDGESRKTVPNDPKNKVAQIAEGAGPVEFCGDWAGQLSLVEGDNGEKVLLGTAHGFYKENGQPKCNDHYAFFSPDMHYQGTKSNINPFKTYKVKFPPINAHDAKKYAESSLIPKGKFGKLNLNDIVIFKLEEGDPILNSQRKNAKRIRFKLSSIKNSDLPSLTKHNPTLIIADHSNYKKGLETAIEQDCQIQSSKKYVTHVTSCDTGPGSSGALILVLDKTGTPYIAGIAQGGTTAREISMNDYKSQKEINSVIPIDQVRAQFEKYIGKQLEPPKDEYNKKPTSKPTSA